MMKQSRPEGVEDQVRAFFKEPVELYVSDALKSRVDQGATVRTVLERFRDGAEAVVVVNDAEQPVGILTPSDMGKLTQAFQHDKPGLVTEVMTQKPVLAYADEPLEAALLRIKQHGFIMGIPVVDPATGKYKGFLSRTKVHAELEDFTKLL